MPQSHRYDAFISYRHVEPDRSWAKWLHGALETFKTPKPLVAKGIAPRINRVFRDEEELPASADLSKEIDDALEQSSYLVVVCSPRTPESEWVNQEVVRFRELGRHDRILALLIEGEPAQSFPRALVEIRTEITDDQGETVAHIEDVEPLAADVREERNEPERFLKRMAMLRVAASLLGCRFDDLRQREAERRRRRLTLVGAGLCLLVAALSILTLVALRARDDAESARANAERARDAEAIRKRQYQDLSKLRWLLSAVASEFPRNGWAERMVRLRIQEVRSVLSRIPEYRAELRRRDAASEDEDWTTEELDRLLNGDLLKDLVDDGTRAESALPGLVRRFSTPVGYDKERDQRRWEGTTQSISDRKVSPEYAGLKISWQFGLLPIGRDPDSGLFEFVHLYSGSLPARGHDGQLAYEDDAAIVFVLIPGGVYSMGAQNSDEDLPNFDESAQPDEGPVRIVNIAPFFLAKHECTQAQWRRLTEGGEPSRFQPRDHFEGVSLRNPVETVSCVEVEATLERFGLRLPSEAEWEYSCRAGTSYQSFWSGGDERALAKAAWFSGNAGKQTHRVGTRAPNPWGLFDTHGNVGEWCADHYGSYVEAPTSGVARRIAWDAGPGHALRVVRGGWWNLSAGEARSARRRYDKAHFLSHFVGFRPTRSIEQSSPPRAEGTSER